MARSNDSLPAWGMLVLRVGPGIMMITAHGWSKLMNFGQRAGTFSDPIGLGPALGFTLVVFAEVFCAALVALGLFTRLATVPLILFFLVAALVQHAADPFQRKELPLLYLFAYVAIALVGPGRFSLDGMRRRG